MSLQTFQPLPTRDYIIGNSDAKPFGELTAILSRESHAAGYRVEFVIGARRFRAIAWLRQRIYYLMADTGASLPMIGRVMGGRDHTTILHGIQAHASRNDLPMPGHLRDGAAE